ncbi:MAG: biotin transport system substrate-specific component [bacterium]|nr:biotin transport system substrate-specific component [bacterium]
MKAENITKVALFAALTAVGAQISIPIGTVPVTLQALFVLLCGMLLEPKLALASQLIYLLMGAIGLPVFAGFKGGLAHLYGPTAGYLWSFPIASLMVSKFSFSAKGFLKKLLWGLVGIGVIYFLGWSRLGFFLHGDFHKAFHIGVVPFVGIDVAKAFLASVIAEKVKVFGVARQKA